MPPAAPITATLEEAYGGGKGGEGRERERERETWRESKLDTLYLEMWLKCLGYLHGSRERPRGSEAAWSKPSGKPWQHLG